ncbi:MAG: histidine phosphatase family protein [Euryarchaeota archaeon]|nr:histidine phosphatase family protein [Euryarchaeota archaeon]|tara:strand:- start:1312 stop:1776 length:465 start_codon:yes stop_codon:yes gene_type:complete
MYRRLIVMRHAKSSWKDPRLEDHDRPLNKRGIKDAPRIAEELHSRGWTPDLILVSSSRRTIQTLEMMKNRFGDLPSEVRPGIYHASLHDLLKELDDMVINGTTMILGHNPGSEILINRLSGIWTIMPTASAALLVESDSTWDLEDVIRPKDLQN